MKKVCKKCGVEKPVSDFAKGGKQLRADGNLKQYYHTTCKKCVNKGPRVRTDNIDPKVCSTCGISKSLSEYAFENNRYRAQCKACKYKQRVKFRSENPEVIEKERDRNRWRHNNIPEVAERNRKQSRETHMRHGEKYKKKAREKYANDPIYREKLKQEQRDRWANNPEHRAKSKDSTRKWIEKNRERYDANNNRYYQENKEKIRAYAKQYREENPEHHKKLRKYQYEKHKDKLVTYQQELRKNRRHHLIERLGGKCIECGSTQSLQFDHIDPFKKSFTIASKMTAPIEVLYEEVDKCQLLCPECHFNKTKNEWLDGTLYEKRYGEEEA